MKTILFQTLWRVVLIVVIFSCDPFFGDSIPKEKQITFIQTDYFILPGTALILDVKSMVDHSWVSGKLSVTQNPARGKLVLFDTLLLMYTPEPSFTEGADQFVFSVSNENTVATKAITITVATRTTDIPCDKVSIHAVEDNVMIYQGSDISIKFLNNDRICGVNPENISGSIYSKPKHALASLRGDSIQLTPEPEFFGRDTLIYKITANDEDVSSVSYGLIAINVQKLATCSMTLKDDFFRITFIEPASRSVVFELIVTDNDNLCGIDSEEFIESIVGSNLTASIKNGLVRLVLSPTDYESGFVQFTYQLCGIGVCKQASVHLQLSWRNYSPSSDLNIFLWPNDGVYAPFDMSLNIKKESPTGSNLYDGIDIITGNGVSGTLSAGQPDGKYALTYDITKYWNLQPPIATDFTVSICSTNGTINGELKTIVIRGHDTEDLWDGPVPIQYFEKKGNNYFNFSPITAIVQSTGLMAELSWDAGDGTAGDVNLDLYLYQAKYFTNSRVASSAETPYPQFESINVNLKSDDTYLLVAAYISGTSNNVNFALKVSTHDGTINGNVKEYSMKGNFTLDSIGRPDCGNISDCRQVIAIQKRGTDLIVN